METVKKVVVTVAILAWVAVLTMCTAFNLFFHGVAEALTWMAWYLGMTVVLLVVAVLAIVALACIVVLIGYIKGAISGHKQS